MLSGEESQYGLPKNWLSSVEFAESSGVQHAISPKGAKGPFQFTDATAKDYGVTDPYDFVQESQAAAKYYSNLFKKYGNDQRKALAAYNWGPGALDADIKQYGSDWEQHVPSDTEAYINRVLKLLSQSGSSQESKDAV
jgi:soluble lytic murein transglycosylase-like protein